MRIAIIIALCALVAIGGHVARIKRDHKRIEEAVAKLRDQAREQKAIQDELCGIVRRLGVRVGRLEETTVKP